MASYDAMSPYYTTPYSGFFLDIMNNRALPKQGDDTIFIINQTYQYRPDLLAFDLYDESKLWWVFYQRNPNTLTEPPFDFVIGKQIYIPKLSTLKSVLGF
jgi:hypothetical protein